eukprot:273111_1
MDGLLKQARKSLTQYFANTAESKMLKIEERISKRIMRKARGIAFITEVKGGFLFGAKGGSGIIIARTDDITSSITVQKTKFRPWSPPCAVGFGGVSAGFIAGLTKIDHIIVLPTQQHIDIFMGAGQLSLKGSADMHIYKYGRNGDAGLSVNSKAVAPIVSYSFGVKGLFAGVSFDGELMTTRGYCNEMYYGKKLCVEDILCSTTKSNDDGASFKASGHARMLSRNRDYETLIQMLNDYCVDEHLDNNNYNPPAMNNPNHVFKEEVDNGYHVQNGDVRSKNIKQNGVKKSNKKLNKYKEDYPHQYQEEKEEETEEEESEEEEEHALEVNDDNQGNNGNAKIWNDKVY